MANLADIDITVVKKDVISRLFTSVITMMEDVYNPVERFKKFTGEADSIFAEAEGDEFIGMCNDTNIIDIINSGFGVNISEKEVGDKIELKADICTYTAADSDNPDLPINNSIVHTIDKPVATNEVVETKPEVEKTVENDEQENNSYNGIQCYDGFISNVRDIFPAENNNTVLIIKDQEGNYVKNDENLIIAVNNIDGYSLEASTLVSKKWFEKASEFYSEEESGDDCIEDIEEDTVEQVGMPGDEIPTGKVDV
jgi:hypothetical protein